MASPYSQYTEEKGQEICEWIAEGNNLQNLKAAGLPGWSTIQKWLTRHPTFLRKYEEAQAIKADWQFSKLEELEEAVLRGDFNQSNVTIQAARVAIDSMKWRLSKMKPRTFGDNKHQSVTVDVGSNYSALLESLDRDDKLIDITPDV